MVEDIANLPPLGPDPPPVSPPCAHHPTIAPSRHLEWSKASDLIIIQ